MNYSVQAQRVIPINTAVNGRVRLKVDGLRRSPRLKTVLESKLLDVSGISRVTASEVTSNVLVIYEPLKILVDELVAYIDDLLAAHPPATHATPTAVVCRQKEPENASKRKAERAATTAAASSPHWHALSADSILLQMESSERLGLSSTLAADRLTRYGPNCLATAPPRSSLSIILSQFMSLPVALLGVSAAVSLFTGGLVDAGVIVGVVAINAAIGFVTEHKAERTISALSLDDKHLTQVVRNGKICNISEDAVVIGDILVLAPGTRVSADARLLKTQQLSVDESALTGESLPVAKFAEPLSVDDVALADRCNMIYMGTVVTGGSGLAVVVATGQNTEIGIIQTLIGVTRPPGTPMQRQLETLGNQLVVMSGAICGLVFMVGILRGYGAAQMLRAAISLAVAAVPEGLPTVSTTTLALGIHAMRRRNVLVRRLSAVETLGSVQVICLDKTGTLTENRMQVTTLYTGMKRIAFAENTLSVPEGEINLNDFNEIVKLLHVAVLCNEAVLEVDDGDHRLNGSATETALVQFAIDLGVSVLDVRNACPLIDVQYRTEVRKYMLTRHQRPDQVQFIAIKGSPEEVLGYCRWHIVDGDKQALTETQRESIRCANDTMAGDALRVLGFAYTEDASNSAECLSDLTWLGLAGLADPVRRGTVELIEAFHRAGIRTVMITGDQSATAYAIGKNLCLSGDSDMEILDSTQLESLAPEVLAALANKVSIFSRVSPSNKLQIVQGLQRHGNVVAMTGDGINDGPALKAADIGVAMGTTGTEVARAAADVILENDGLQTMIVAVSEGRTIYNNIQKSVHFLLSSNISEILVMLGSIAAGTGQPLSPMQLLWINLLTDVFPALALSMEPPEPDILTLPPRDPSEPIVRHVDFARYGFESLAITAGTLGAYGYGIMRYGVGPQANTLASITLISSQLLHAYTCRSTRHGLFSGERLPINRHLNLAVIGTFALQLLPMLWPRLRSLLGMGAIGFPDLLAAATGSALPFLTNEAMKAVFQRQHLESKRRSESSTIINSTPGITYRPSET